MASEAGLEKATGLLDSLRILPPCFEEAQAALKGNQREGIKTSGMSAWAAASATFPIV